MKHLIVFVGAFLTCSSAMAGQTLAQKVLAPVIRYQCHEQLDGSRLWQASTFLLQLHKKQKLANQVCDCVAGNALNDIKTTDLAKVLVSEETKRQVSYQAVKNSLSICVPKLLQ